MNLINSIDLIITLIINFHNLNYYFQLIYLTFQLFRLMLKLFYSFYLFHSNISNFILLISLFIIVIQFIFLNFILILYKIIYFKLILFLIPNYFNYYKLINLLKFVFLELIFLSHINYLINQLRLIFLILIFQLTNFKLMILLFLKLVLHLLFTFIFLDQLIDLNK